MGGHIAPCATFVRKAAVPKSVFDVGLTVLMDWDLSLAMLHQGSRMVWLPTPLGAFRRHGNQLGQPASLEEHNRVRGLIRAADILACGDWRGIAGGWNTPSISCWSLLHASIEDRRPSRERHAVVCQRSSLTGSSSRGEGRLRQATPEWPRGLN